MGCGAGSGKEKTGSGKGGRLLSAAVEYSGVVSCGWQAGSIMRTLGILQRPFTDWSTKHFLDKGDEFSP